jgi:hypothetical protein
MGEVATSAFAEPIGIVCWRCITDRKRSTNVRVTKLIRKLLKLLFRQTHAIFKNKVTSGPSGALEWMMRLKVELEEVGVCNA